MPRSARIGAVVALIVIGLASVGVILYAGAQPDPLEVVQGFRESRNAGDVDRAMSYLADDAELFEASMANPRGEARIRAILPAQAVAGWTIAESGCSADGGAVTCRYQMDDAILRRVGVTFLGRPRKEPPRCLVSWTNIRRLRRPGERGTPAEDYLRRRRRVVGNRQQRTDSGARPLAGRLSGNPATART